MVNKSLILSLFIIRALVCRRIKLKASHPLPTKYPAPGVVSNLLALALRLTACLHHHDPFVLGFMFGLDMDRHNGP